MKRAALPLLAFLALYSCDRVEFPVEATDVISGGGFGDDSGVDFSDTPAQKVFIEDFTGQGCGNCPSAALTAASIQDGDPNNVVVLGVHAGFFATAPGNPHSGWDLSTPAGEVYDTDFGFNTAGNPNGLVNRTEYNGALVVPPGSWGSAVNDFLTNNPTPSVDLDLATVITGTTLEAIVGIEILSDLTGNYNLVVAVSENNITAPQTNYLSGGDPAYPNPVATDYVHKHVLRANMNGNYGSSIIVNEAAAGINGTFIFETEMDPIWNSSELSVVAYLINFDTNEVVQVEEIHVD